MGYEWSDRFNAFVNGNIIDIGYTEAVLKARRKAAAKAAEAAEEEKIRRNQSGFQSGYSNDDFGQYRLTNQYYNLPQEQYGAPCLSSPTILRRRALDIQDFIPEDELQDEEYELNEEYRRPTDKQRRYAQGGGVMGDGYEQSNQSAIGRGSQQGTMDARNSYEMNDHESNRALGMALMHFGSGLNKTGYGPGIGGRFGAMADSMLPAMNAYNAEEDRARKFNHLNRKMEMDEAYRRDKLEEEKRYHDLAKRQLKSSENERNLKVGEQRTAMLQEKYPGAVAFELLPKNSINAIMKDLRAESSKEGKYLKALHQLDKYDDIVKKNPNISTSLASVFYSGADAGVMANLKRSLVSEKDRTDFDIGTKIISDLFRIEMESGNVAGKAMTDMFKKVVGNTLPSFGITKDANLYVSKLMREDYFKGKDKSRLASEMISNRFLVPYKVDDYVPKTYEESKSSEVEKGNESVNKDYLMKENASIDEELKRINNELLNGAQ